MKDFVVREQCKKKNIFKTMIKVNCRYFSSKLVHVDDCKKNL